MTTPSREPRPSTRLPRGLAPLGYRNFGLFWLGFAVSNTGKWIEQTGAVWLIYVLTGSPVMLGLLGVARAAPAILLGPIAGVVADRVDQRKLLFITQAIALVSSFALGLIVASGWVEPWHVYLQVALQSAISAFDAADRQALFPRLVPRIHLAQAVTLASTAARSSAFIGPAVGGLAIAKLGVAAPFLLNAATFVGLMAAVALMRGVVPRAPRAGSTFRGELSEGLRYMMRMPVLSGLLKLEIVFSLLQMNAVMITIIGREVLGVGPEGLGGLLAAPALGSLIGIGLLLARGQSRFPGRFIVISQLGYAITLITFALSQNFVLSFAGLALAGLLDTLASVTRTSVIQLAAPGRMRGRVMGNLGTVTRGLGPLAETQSGLLAAVIGGPLAVVTAATALALSAAATARANPVLWHYSYEDALRERDQAAYERSLAEAALADTLVE